MRIKTPVGTVTLVEPQEEQLRGVARYLPLTGPLPDRPGGAAYGLVMQQGDQEAWAVKQQTVDVERSRWADAYAAQRHLVVLAFRQYLGFGFSGALMPVVYHRPKKRGRVEVGVAYFGSAAPSAAPAGGCRSLPRLERMHGRTFREMVAGFIHCMGAASKAYGVPLQPIIGLDYHPSSTLGELAFSFLAHNRDLYSLSPNPGTDDPMWAALRSTGIRKAWFLPSVPLGLPARKGRRQGKA